ncbi:hypothetical protein N656DRAFT_744193 [Canariomyces notabilis]|uniref:Response regulatory domain-containing protein n=1 Tax=Canariomyces notabilis TaxID=2074819 RepID=A0AAN6TNX4_9PEZI|nr:hypothetical protein N656DRAFT_744193 [Canariomyces arenarius]
MGDLKSKLRAKFPRRNSGFPPSLPSNKTGDGSGISNISAETNPAATGPKATDPAATAAPDAPEACHSPGLSGPDTRQATRLGTARLGTQQQTAKGTSKLGDATGGSNGHATGSPPDAASDPHANREKNGETTTNNSPPRPVRVASMHSTPKDPNSDANDAHSNERRRSAASRLESVNEKSVDGSKKELTPSNAAPTGESAAPVPTATDAVRRISLSDPPTPDTRPAEPVLPPSATKDPAGPASNSQLHPSSSLTRPPAPPRRQSLLPSRQTTLIRTLLSSGDLDPTTADQLLPISANMVTRKIWVKRPGGSPTLVSISEEDLVDDVRDLILRKYANSLGRQFDPPDVTLRIIPREQQMKERALGPEEPIARTLDAYFPGGQTVDEALIIDVPHRRTPRASPRSGPPHAQHATSAGYEDALAVDSSTDYFGPGAVAHIPVTIAGTGSGGTPHAISVLNTGQVPQIPSPGGTRSRGYRERPDRPRLGRQHTSSPTILNVVGAGGHTATIAVSATHGTPQASSIARSRTHSSASSEQLVNAQAAPSAPPLPTPPAQEPTPAAAQRTTSPPPRTASPRPNPVTRPKKKKTSEPPALPAGMLNGGVPPINVLIVEDNPINLRLLEAFVKRLKVRWQTAMDGREAVNKWRKGGFHLVLMDIQLPVMSGLEATREIRRLERLNSIGVFSQSSNNNNSKPSAAADGKTNGGGESEGGAKDETNEEDKLSNRELFKSPVIIVALTASSLQSDRHEALAAGCNDFLTKPVTYVWLERKVMEWGCMQALIDYDGWRKWKSYSSQKSEEDTAAKKTKAKKAKQAPNSSSSEGQ